MDNLVFEESINTELSSSEFVDKQWLYVNDNNNSSYSGQIVIDTTSLSNCGSYINWSEAFLAIPLILQAEGDATMTADLALDWMMGLKNGYWQILHSLTCEFNNGSIIQQTPFLNVFCSFKNLTSWSEADLKDWGSVCGFAPDTCNSWLYNTKAEVAANLNILATSGTGIANNRNAQYVSIKAFIQGWYDPTAGAPQALSSGHASCYNWDTPASTTSANVRQLYNKGFAQRQSYLNYSSTLNDGTSLANLSANQSALMSGTGAGITANISGYSAIFQSYVSRAATTRAIVFDAVVRLKDVADFFQKCPLLKGSTMRLYLNTNQTYFTTTATGGLYQHLVATQANTQTYGDQVSAGALTLTSTPVILGGGGTNPIMVASCDQGQGLYNMVPLVSDAGAANQESIKFGLSIVKTQFTQFTTQYQAPITSVRLYAPAYTMSPIAEQRYLSLAPTKKVVYNDIFFYSFTNVAPGTFSFLVTNGIPNVRGVLVVPMLPKASNGSVSALDAASTTTASILSPFSTTGGTPDPISLTNFNIQVSGRNLFINNELYNYEQFVEQLVSSNQLNGSLTTSLASGLIGYEDFQSLYRYYYGNVSRSIPSEDGVAKAIQITGLNNSSVNVDFMVFVEFERQLTIDVRTGARIA